MSSPVDAPRPRQPEQPGQPGQPELARDDEWQRLDPRMLLVHPIRELIRFLPVLVAIVVAGASGGGATWQLLGVAVPVAVGLLRYLTTRFRIADGRVELRRGLLNRHVLSTPVDRVRTVELTSRPIHRVLGLTTVRIGTGTTSGDDDDRLDLDGLPIARARELRRELLRAGTPALDVDPSVTASAPPAADRLVVRLDPSWVRFGPFTGSGLVIAAAAVGVLAQALNTLGVLDRVDVSGLADRGERVSVPLLVASGALTVVVVVSLLSVGGYVVTNWGFGLTRSAADGRGGTWHLRRGLFTTRETTLDDDRVAGVTLAEPLGLRLVRGARLLAIVTGLDRKQRGSSALVPPAPRAVARAVAGVVLGSDEPMGAPLVRHGVRAVRRRWTRALTPALVVAAAAIVGVAVGATPWLLLALLVLPAAAALALDRSRSLGHRLVAGHLVARSGSVVRRTRVIDVDHVIGWTLRATWFQRRAGLTTLVATTAGGPQAVPVPDVPEEVAVALARTAGAGLIEPFAGSSATPG